MDGVHDLGGMHGFGPVRPERDEPIFHADWERRALALTLAAGGLARWSIDRSRHVRESLPPTVYLAGSYYEIWVRALERLLAESGLLDPSGAPQVRPPDAAATRAALDRGSAYTRRPPPDRPEPRFDVGSLVRTRNDHPAVHTRLPRYARGRRGRIVTVHGAHVLPDENAAPPGAGRPGAVAWLYTVEFDARELWGDDGDPHGSVCVEAFEPYLEPA